MRANQTEVSGTADLRHTEVKRATRAGGHQNQVVVRFWIITMMLVLFGLATLKLR
ncbi:MAG: hypothetical protein IPP91_15185 [Betaproteobacteria bacterium]|nr:hypothetical protein [Betaproteobacteria bacterium]